ncbi:MAG: phosphotransferase, partial [Candidatus Omnitrophota bacterium]
DVHLEEKAQNGDRLALDFISEAGRDLGMAMRAFKEAYPKEGFTSLIVLGSSVGENFGKGVDEVDGIDLFIRLAREAAGFKGIVRSRLGVEREFLAFMPEKAGKFSLFRHTPAPRPSLQQKSLNSTLLKAIAFFAFSAGSFLFFFATPALAADKAIQGSSGIIGFVAAGLVILTAALLFFHFRKAFSRKASSKRRWEIQKTSQNSDGFNKESYGKNGLKMVYDTRTGKVWERYVYRGRKLVQVVLYNPVSKEDIIIAINGETSEGEFGIFKQNDISKKIGRIYVNFNYESLISIESIEIEESYQGQGVGKTVMRWLALKAYRENKALDILCVLLPRLAHFASSLYLLEGFKIEKKESIITFTNETQLIDFLFKQEYFWSLSSIGCRGGVYFSVGDNNAINILYEGYEIGFSPEGYAIEVENSKVFVRSPEGKKIPVLYCHGLSFQGPVDAAKIGRDQQKDYENNSFVPKAHSSSRGGLLLELVGPVAVLSGIFGILFLFLYAPVLTVKLTLVILSALRIILGIGFCIGLVELFIKWRFGKASFFREKLGTIFYCAILIAFLSLISKGYKACLANHSPKSIPAVISVYQRLNQLAPRPSLQQKSLNSTLLKAIAFFAFSAGSFLFFFATPALAATSSIPHTSSHITPFGLLLRVAIPLALVLLCWNDVSRWLKDKITAKVIVGYSAPESIWPKWLKWLKHSQMPLASWLREKVVYELYCRLNSSRDFRGALNAIVILKDKDTVKGLLGPFGMLEKKLQAVSVMGSFRSHDRLPGQFLGLLNDIAPLTFEEQALLILETVPLVMGNNRKFVADEMDAVLRNPYATLKIRSAAKELLQKVSVLNVEKQKSDDIGFDNQKGSTQVLLLALMAIAGAVFFAAPALAATSYIPHSSSHMTPFGLFLSAAIPLTLVFLCWNDASRWLEDKIATKVINETICSTPESIWPKWLKWLKHSQGSLASWLREKVVYELYCRLDSPEDFRGALDALIAFKDKDTVKGLLGTFGVLERKFQAIELMAGFESRDQASARSLNLLDYSSPLTFEEQALLIIYAVPLVMGNEIRFVTDKMDAVLSNPGATPEIRSAAKELLQKVSVLNVEKQKTDDADTFDNRKSSAAAQKSFILPSRKALPKINGTSTEYINIEKNIQSVVKQSAKVITVRLTADNGRAVEIRIPDPAKLNKGQAETIYRSYIAKLYAQGLALGNGPTEHIYVEAYENDSSICRGDIEEAAIKSLDKYFKETGAPLLSKANAGNRVEIIYKPEDFKAKSPIGLKELIEQCYKNRKITLPKTMVTIGLDVGGQGIKSCVLVDGKDVTDELSPEAANEKELRKQDKSLRYRYAFKYEKLEVGDSGKEFSNRLVNFVQELKTAVEAKYGKVSALFINLPGNPDYAHDRMASLGELSRGFGKDMGTGLSEANTFIEDLRNILGDALLGYGNDMTGWGLSIAQLAGFKDAVILITGSGIGVQQIENGEVVAGANEGGHQIFNVKDGIESRAENSPLGSYEDWAGSIRGIMAVANQIGLTEKLKQLGISKIEVEHIGLAASGINPLDTSLKLDSDSELVKLSLEVWDIVEQREAQHVIFLYKLTGKTKFAFGGGTTAAGTGKIRQRLLQKYVNQYSKDLNIQEIIEVTLVKDANAARGAAIKAAQLVQEYSFPSSSQTDADNTPLWRLSSMRIKDYLRKVVVTGQEKANAIIQNYDLGVNSLNQVQYEDLIGGTSLRKPLLIYSPKGKFVLKYATNDSLKADFIVSVQLYLHAQGLPVARIQQTRHVGYLLKIKDWYWFLEEYTPDGREITWAQMRPEQFFSLGKMMASIHNVLSGFIPKGEKRELLAIDIATAEEDFLNLKQRLILKGGNFSRSEQLFLDNADFIFSQFASLKNNLSLEKYKKLPQAVIHGDMKTGNVKWMDDRDDVMVLFDWERSRQGQARIEEFKNALLGTALKMERKYVRSSFIALLRGYQAFSNHKLTMEELEAIPYVLGAGAFLWDVARWLILRRDDIDSSDERYEVAKRTIDEFRKITEDFNGEWWAEEKIKCLIEDSDTKAYEKIKNIFINSDNILVDFDKSVKDGVLDRALPFFGLLESAGMKDHSLEVFKHFINILENNHVAFNQNARSPEEISETVFCKHHILLRNLIKTKEDREFYFLVTLLHDIGTIVSKPKHHAIGARLIKEVLKKYISSISEERISEAQYFIDSHVDIGTMYTGERTAGYLFSKLLKYSGDFNRQEKNLDWLIPFTLADMRGVRGGEFIDDYCAQYYLDVRKMVRKPSELSESLLLYRLKGLAAEYKGAGYLENKIAGLSDEPTRTERQEIRLTDLRRYKDKYEKVISKYNSLPDETRQLIEDYIPSVKVFNYAKSLFRFLSGEEKENKQKIEGNYANFIRLLVLSAFIAKISKDLSGQTYNWVDYVYDEKTKWLYFDFLNKKLSSLPELEKLSIDMLEKNFNHDKNSLFGLIIGFNEAENKIIFNLSPRQLNDFKDDLAVAQKSLILTPEKPLSSERVKILDTTLRDGKQTPGVVLTKEERLAIARAIDEIGVPEMEVGFPATGQIEQDIISSILSLGLKAKLFGLSREMVEDVDATEKCGLKNIRIFVATSDSHIQYKLAKTREWVMSNMVQVVRYAKKKGFYVDVACEDFTNSDDNFIIEFIKAVSEAGADRVLLADTKGQFAPWELEKRLSNIIQNTNIPIGFHGHNDYGLATANALAAVRAGASFVDVTVNNLGERAGNASLQEVVMALEDKLAIKTGINTEGLTHLSKLVAERFGIPLRPNAPITGDYISTHESGIHADAILKGHPELYEPFPPEKAGGKCRIVIGYNSGTSSIRKFFEDIGIQVSSDEAQAVRVLIQEKLIQNKERNLKGPLGKEEIIKMLERARIQITPPSRNDLSWIYSQKELSFKVRVNLQAEAEDNVAQAIKEGRSINILGPKVKIEELPVAYRPLAEMLKQAIAAIPDENTRQSLLNTTHRLILVKPGQTGLAQTGRITGKNFVLLTNYGSYERVNRIINHSSVILDGFYKQGPPAMKALTSLLIHEDNDLQRAFHQDESPEITSQINSAIKNIIFAPKENASSEDASSKTPKYSLNNKDEFVIENYNYAKPFASFFPGIAGKYGIPMWVFYVNRGQAIASFGTKDKDHAILEFWPANKAWQMAASHGFRTFIKVTSDKGTAFYEPFQNGPVEDMRISSHGLTIAERNPSAGIGITVDYATVPNDTFAGLIRSVSLKNTGKKPVKMQLLDGLPQIAPAYINDWLLKHVSRTAEAWFTVKNLENGVPFFKLGVEIADKPEVIHIEEGNFYLSFIHTKEGPRIIKPVVDPQQVFGQDTAFSTPVCFSKEKDFRYPANQVTIGRTPCAFSPFNLELAAGEEKTLYTVIGNMRDLKMLNSSISRIIAPGYIEQKKRENAKVIAQLKDDVATKSSSREFDLYAGQTYLDNIMRGGYPVVFRPDSGKAKQVFYLYSRKHGDLERDYNSFVTQASYFSQGNGNYRDVNQNRRLDVWFNPEVKEENLVCFFNLLQADGFNPLVVKGASFKIQEGVDIETVLMDYTEATDISPLQKFFAKPFSPGELAMFIENNGIKLKSSYDKFISFILSCAAKIQEAEHGEGFWTDHWTYNLDLLESFLGVYPEQCKNIIFEKKEFTYFDNIEVIQPRAEKYTLLNNQPRQLNSICADNGKKAMIQGRAVSPNLVRTDYGKGQIYRTTLINKLLCLAANKMASLDPFGIGIEMEAGKPNWYDALNGLPALFGSSLCETFELKRLLIFIKDSLEQAAIENLPVTEEVYNFLAKLNDLTREYFESAAAEKDYTYWDKAYSYKEDYRLKTKFGFSGAEKELSVNELILILDNFLKKVGFGIDKAFDKQQNTYPAYFINEVTKYEILDGQRIKPLEFSQKALPLFLESFVHALRTTESADKAQALYGAVRNSGLYDRKLKMYKVCDSLEGMPEEIGRCRTFPSGWLENESIWLHMEYKYLLETLKSGLAEQFYEDFKSALIPFQSPERYGRSILENSSFLASSAYPDESLQGNGFVARLSGSTVEFLQIWLIMNLGKRPFFLNERNELNLKFAPSLAGWLFDKHGRYSFKFLSKTNVIYHNSSGKGTFGEEGVSPWKISFDDKEGNPVRIYSDTIPAPYAEQIRAGLIKEIEVYFRSNTLKFFASRQNLASANALQLELSASSPYKAPQGQPSTQDSKAAYEIPQAAQQAGNWIRLNIADTATNVSRQFILDPVFSSGLMGSLLKKALDVEDEYVDNFVFSGKPVYIALFDLTTYFIETHSFKNFEVIAISSALFDKALDDETQRSLLIYGLREEFRHLGGLRSEETATKLTAREIIIAIPAKELLEKLRGYVREES